MSDAPERIWATTNATVWKVVTWFRQRTALGCTEYVRADLYAELEAQLAEAKAALVDIISVGGCYGGAAHMQKVDEIAREALAKLEEPFSAP